MTRASLSATGTSGSENSINSPMTPSQQVIAGLGLTTILMLSISCGRATLASSMQSTNQATSPAPPAEDRLERESKRLAGPSAINCGRVQVRGDPKTATDCVLAAQKAGKPFRVRYDLQGIDSAVAVAIVRTPVGTVGTLSYDSDPSGGGRTGGGVIFPKPCPKPIQLWVTRSGRINCFPLDTSRQRDAMSPTAEPY